MDPLQLLVFGLIAGWFAGRWYSGWRPAKQTATEPSLPAAEAESLSQRLHKLNETLEPFARNAAHTNELAAHDDFRKAVDLLCDPAVPLTTVIDYAFGQAWVLSCAAFAALSKRSDGSAAAKNVPAHFDNLSVWQMQFALYFLAEAEPRPPAGAPLMGFRDWWIDSAPLRHTFEDYFATLGDDDPGEIGPEVAALPNWTKQSLCSFLDTVRHPIARRIALRLGASSPIEGHSTAFLDSVGRFWSADGESAALIEPELWSSALKAVEKACQQRPARAVLVSGEALVGKTTFLRLLARRMATRGWRVFQASGADLQAGQMYIGQLEGRIRQALAELEIGRKIVWYVPDLLALAMSGTHQSQSASILDQIAPAVASGQVLLWTEASPAATARLMQISPALRRSFEIVRLDAMDADDTLELAEAYAERIARTSGAKVEPSFAHTAVDAAQHYLSSVCLPGSALSLMKSTAQRFDKARDKRIAGHDILETLSQLTGLPMSILDGSERLALDSVRQFFSDRVVGQPEAVDSIVDRIAMLKSGLNDPGKPIGVFLFAGPTGTGKTELAKSVAEYLFGSVERMIRLDMSEYQTPESVGKVLGSAGLPAEAETLIARIRKQPYSLVLLDEFEKAHPQIWDLFLQVFDDGRLSDASGHTADFRHCLIILTTNLGATAHRDSGIGFTPSQSGFTNEQVLRSIGQTFRPEFQNRLDKVIVFKPLNRELMRKILTRELTRIFERRGLKDRDWAVEWDASALEFLLEKGFSPDMGARPLKRAIDHYVIAPLAQTIVERRFPEGDQFVFVRRDGAGLRADFVDPDGGGEPFDPDAASAAAEGAAPSIAQLIRMPSGGGAELTALSAALKPITARIESPEWDEEKRRMTDEINAPDFWNRKDRFDTLARLELMDRLAVAADTAMSLQGRIARSGDRASKSVRELVSRLATQIHLVNEGLKDLEDKSPAEIALLVVPAFAAGADDDEEVRGWCNDVAAMYAAWAKNRNMRSQAIDTIAGFSVPAMIVSGFGAHRALAREAGLHILENAASGGAPSRIAAQVLVAAPPVGNASKAEIRRSLAAAFTEARAVTGVVRRYRRTPSPLVRNADGSWRSGKVEDVLRGNFDLIEHGVL